MIEQLFSASLRQDDLGYLNRLDARLLDPQEIEAIEWATKHRETNGRAPSKRLTNEHPKHCFMITNSGTDEPLNAIWRSTTDELKQRYSNRVWTECQAESMTEGRFPTEKVIALGKLLASVSTEDSETFLTIDRDDIYSGKDLLHGVDFGFSYIDETTGGILPGELAVWAARPGVGKSLIVCHEAVRWARQGKKVMVVSCEMPARQLVHRMDAILGVFNPKIFRQRGPLPAAALAGHRIRVNHELDLIRDVGGDIIFPKNRSITINNLVGEVTDKRPDVLIVDGIYLIKVDGRNGHNMAGWEAVKTVSNGVKQDIALEFNIPVLGTTQLKRNGNKEGGFELDDVGYSDAIGQDADLLVAMAKDPSGHIIDAEVVKCRNGSSMGGSSLTLDWDAMSVQEIIRATTTVRLNGAALP